MIRAPKNIDTGIEDPEAVTLELLQAVLPILQMKDHAYLSEDIKQNLKMAEQHWRQLLGFLLPHVSYVDNNERILSKIERLGRIAARIKSLPVANEVRDSAHVLHQSSRVIWKAHARDHRVIEAPASTPKHMMISQMVDFHISTYCQDCNEHIFEHVHVPNLVHLIGRDAAWGTFNLPCARDRSHKVHISSSYEKGSAEKLRGRIRGDLFMPETGH